MKKRLLAIAMGALLLPMGVKAVPAYPYKRTITRADGTRLELTFSGDEHFSYYRAADGTAMRRRGDGDAFEVIPEAELRQLREAASVAAQQSNARRARRKAIGNVQPLVGKKKGIIILMQYPDQAFSTADAQAVYTDFFNKEGYADHNMNGSVADYFKAQSYGQFEIEFDVAGPYTSKNKMAYYGQHTSAGAHDAHADLLIVEAVKKADKDVNFADYDWDGDGEVDQVFVIYAGYGENYGASENTIWPHESHLSGDAQTLDGVKIDTYACSCELRGTTGTTLEGIGTPCHEFSHCLGYPDMYDTSPGGENFGMGPWDLMCSGSYNGASRTPASYTAYERWMAGWLTPTEIDEETTVTGMKALVDSPEAYVLYNAANRNEYYLLENRQLRGYDAALPGHGLLVVHVDYDEKSWGGNAVNTKAERQRMTLIAADGDYTNYPSSLAADPFPGTKGVTSLTDYTTPAATLYNKNKDGKLLMHKAIEGIREAEGGLISFMAAAPELGIPAVSTELVSLSGFKAEWPAVSRATHYDLSLTEVPAKKDPSEALLLKEDFAKCYNAKTGYTDIGTKLNDYLSTKGFSGSKLYQSPSLLRIGTSTTTGKLQTPTMNALTTGRLTIVMTMKPAKDGATVKGKVAITKIARSGSGEVAFEFAKEQTMVLHPDMTLDSRFYLSIEPEAYCYISYLALYDGEFTAEELGVKASTKAPSRVKQQTFTTTKCEYVFGNLDPTCIYQLQVRARSNYQQSLWSEVQEVSFDVDPDGIAATPAEVSPRGSEAEAVYNLAGQRVAEPRKGIYIVGGRKVMR